MMAAVVEYNEEFIEHSVTLGAQMRNLRTMRDELTQRLSSLNVRKMELTLARRSLVVINALIAQAAEERKKIVEAIDAVNQTYASHLASCTHY